MNLAILGGSPVRTAEFPAWPVFSAEEETALVAAIRSGKWGGYGDEVYAFENAFSRMHEVEHAVSCSNGTVALEVALKALNVGSGDEVIVTPFSFIASASAILLCQGIPVFVDIDPETLNLLPGAVEAAITPRTRAIVAVHFGGHPADMDALCAIARRHGLAIVEDCAHALGARWNGKPVGNWGSVGTYSFQSFKLATAGEGGAIASNDPQMADAAWSYCNQGRRRSGAWYEHYSLGSNYRLTALQAAVLGVQLKRVPEQTQARTRSADYLRSRLSAIPGLSTGSIAAAVENHPQYLMTLRYDAEAFSGVSRDVFLAAVQAEGIPLRPVYPHPLPSNPLFRKESLALRAGRGWASIPDYSTLRLPECERVCADGLWLEHQIFLGSTADMDDILTAFEKVQANRGELEQQQEEISAAIAGK